MADVTYVGKVHALIEKKAGWHSVEISVSGKQYPVKADTKLEPLLKQVREIRDGDLVATFTVSETESENINPNSGKPYTERRLEKVEPGAQKQENANGSPTSAAHEYSPDLRDRMIVRQTCLKAAAELLAGHDLEEDPPLDVMKAAQRFEAWVYRDIGEAPFEEAGRPALSEHDNSLPF
jgi:hypothetical protein